MADQPSPLIVQPESPGRFEGAGVVSDVADTIQGIRDGDPAGAGLAATGGVLNLIEDTTDPLQALASAGVGWLIEHLAFLREPLEVLTGDAAQIQAHALTWQNVSKHLSESADQREQGLTGLAGWQGVASEAYRSATARQVAEIRDASAASAELSKQIMVNGVLVATERAIIRDTIADWIGKLAVSAVAAGLLALVSAGISVGGWVAQAVIEATRLAAKLTARIAKLYRLLSKAAEGLAKLADRVGRLGQAGPVRRAADATRKVGDEYADTAEGLRRGSDRLTEVANQGELGNRPKLERPKVPPVPDLAPDTGDAVELGKQANSGDRKLAAAPVAGAE